MHNKLYYILYIYIYDEDNNVLEYVNHSVCIER